MAVWNTKKVGIIQISAGTSFHKARAATEKGASWDQVDDIV